MNKQETASHLQSLGWKQCDYPHESAKDMWYHKDHPACDEGHYLDTEEVLEILAETKE